MTAPLNYPRLKEGSIPCKFPDGASHLSMASTSVRESRDYKRLKLEMTELEQALEQSKQTKEEYDIKTTFNDIVSLHEKLKENNVHDDWTIVCKSDKIVLMGINFDSAPIIQLSMVIDANLQVTAFYKTEVLKRLKEHELPMKVNNINLILELLTILKSLIKSTSNNDPTEKLNIITDLLNEVKDVIPEKESELGFLIEQVSKLCTVKNQYRYSIELMVFCSLLYSISPHGYKFLRNSHNIIIPHPCTLHRVCSKFQTNPIHEIDDNFLGYVKSKYVNIEEKEKIVVLMIDELHINPQFDFKGGNLCGMSHNNESAANSAFVFMVRSLLSPFQEVAHILPVKTIDASDLYKVMHKVIIGLETIGFKIIAIITDNNSINKKAASMLTTPNQVSIVYKHPVDFSRPLFFLIDSVHILKCLRNNWINQKNHGQTMYYPDFENFSNVKAASFSALKKLHEKEVGKLVKYSYGLTLKALHPTNFERQNVKLALQVFDTHVAEGLLVIGADDIQNYKGTSEYIKLVCTWWSVVNVKSAFKGFKKNDEYQKPLTNEPKDPKIIFLNKLLDWLVCWKDMKCDTGCLTKETHFAISHTTYALMQMAEYCITELKFDYFLTGKVQTDIIENRFGKYRQLAGSHHNISIRQVYETEAKLRIQSLFPGLLKSNKFGDLAIHLSHKGDELEESNNNIVNENLRNNVCINNSDIGNIESDIPILTYIAGYCCYSVVKKLNCEICKENLTINKQLLVNVDNSYNLIKTFDRGLLYPHPDVLNIVMHNYIVVQKLVSKEFENEFLSSANQRDVACNITQDIIVNKELFLDLEGCRNGHEQQKVLNFIIRASTNVFLNNYCKMKNDGLVVAKQAIKNRKLLTVSK